VEFVSDVIPIITSIAGVTIAAVSIVFTKRSSKQQQEYNEKILAQQEDHNMKSVKPLLNIKEVSFLSEISIRIENVGIGPMIVKRLEIVDENKRKEENIRNLIRFSMSGTAGGSISSLTWTGVFENRAIEVGESINLITLKRRDEGCKDAFKVARRELIEDIGYLEIGVEYEDIYGNKFYHEPRRSKAFEAAKNKIISNALEEK